jgi:hypothetical protein
VDYFIHLPMPTIKFFIQSKNNPAGIYVRLREGREIDAKAKTKYAINPIDWSDIKGKPKNLREASFKALNNDLETFRNDLLVYYNESINKHQINSQWLKDFINPPLQTDAIPTLLVPYFDYYTKHKATSVSSATHKKFKAIKHLLERFQNESKTQFFIKDVNANFKLKLEEYCIREKYAPNTIARTIKFVKTICYHARNNGVETHFQLDRISVKTEKTYKIFLTKDEIEKLNTVDLKYDYLINARNWLLISCETGQRVSDFMRFTKEQIRYEGSIPLLEFTQAKTNKKIAIPLSKKVIGILKSNNGEFPRKISDQRYNEYIKEVCKLAGINEATKGSISRTENGRTRKENGVYPKYELITSHVGRRSFATNYYGIIPTSLLISATGHSTESMFLEYIGKTETEKAIQLAEYFK